MYLNCHTYFSLRYGTFSETELINLALKNNIKYLALTDINSTSAAMQFIREACETELHITVGVDVRNMPKQLYILLAKTNTGFQELNSFLSAHLHQKKEFPLTAPQLKDCFVIYPFEQALFLDKESFAEFEYIGISVRDLNRLPFNKLKQLKDRLVIQQPVSFRSKKDFNAHRLLRAIDLNILLSQLPQEQEGNLQHQMQPLSELEEAFRDYPHIVENTKKLFTACKVRFKFDAQRENQNQQTYLGSVQEDKEYLRALCRERIGMRYPQVNTVITERLQRELKSIEDLGFTGYFLINYDIVSYGRSKDYPYIGRGSGANSMVAYILGITNVDPIELDLYFERFINVYRSSPPDFDIDFSWKDRDDVTRYIFERFPHCALMGTYVTFQYKAVVRELSKVFGIPKYETDAFLNGNTKGNKNHDTYLQLVQKYGELIHGFPNYLSVHSGGILITHKPVHYYGGTFLPPKGFATVQFDMNIAEAVGIYKFDILAQRGLSKIKDALALIAQNQPEAKILDIDQVYQFKKDTQLNNLLATGDCMGVFYVESPAMRGLMTKLRTHNYIGLVAASSIIRPGVGNGGMKEEFIKRERFPETRTEAHPVLAEILHETHGIMVYQEDVLKVAHYFAGLSLAEADVLRRGMSGKGRSKMQFAILEGKFLKNCREKGYPEDVIQSVWDQVKAFAGYAFAKGHSASYAVESYQSLYLKHYFPLEFMTAVLNNGGGFYRVEDYLNEIRKCGGQLELPCINTSDHPNSIIGTKIYLGLGMIKGLEARGIEKLLTQRQLYGRFTSLEDFVERVPLGLEQLVLLIRIGALRFTGKDKKELLWKAHLLTNPKTAYDAPRLFSTKPVAYRLPDFKSTGIENAYDEVELLEFPLCSRFDLLEAELPKSIVTRELQDHIGQTISICGVVVTVKRVPLDGGRTMFFGTFLDRESVFFDTVHFPDSAAHSFMSGKEVYQVIGKVTQEYELCSIIVDRVIRLPRKSDPRFSDASDFKRVVG
ncbi:DNA polymerase-3 subunit alpha [Leeuwenhoekiella aestuarii]|uniref:DNA-directed DNA polymerase n=1 Tax=Leeuwenhoekiella aestuarii TaxID=2249426 RepID=A0A4Q0NN99_9FLAO|nr:DNA polymerase III subunit alpha [Leeuwenhoekiella aestuarii]RXG11411.1 DNA polymerase-3 subunit alpha [Leeuwenhoekiella aestuarii]RXG12148.1 DNA polymerase-3 subunit alpha [Leeuwenhoekiella aestuarii]